jgi:hypothetical protein
MNVLEFSRVLSTILGVCIFLMSLATAWVFVSFDAGIFYGYLALYMLTLSVALFLTRPTIMHIHESYFEKKESDGVEQTIHIRPLEKILED